MLSRDLLKAVLPILNPKDVHSYAWNALIDYEKSVFVVTDGHMLVQIETPEIKKSAAAAGVKGRCCISVSELKSVVKAMKARDAFDCTRAAVESLGVVDLQPCEALDLAGSYPNYTKVIPEDSKAGAPGVFGLYAAKYMKILEDIEHSSAYIYRTYHLPATRTGALKVVFDCYDSMIITAVLLPKSVESDIRKERK